MNEENKSCMNCKNWENKNCMSRYNKSCTDSKKWENKSCINWDEKLYEL